MLVEVQDVTKQFEATVALDRVSVTFRPAEIHAVIGENGAGKSTLIKVLTGVHKPDAGQILLDKTVTMFAGPRESVTHGISVVHQERNLVPMFSVAENLFLDDVPSRRGFLDYRTLDQMARTCLERVGLALDPKTPAEQLTVAQAQLVEIARALSRRCALLLLDEPTSALTEHEAGRLFSLLRNVRDEGTAVVFVSHKLDEVESLCQKVTVMRDGQVVLASQNLTELRRDELITAMVGREYTTTALPGRPAPTTRRALELRAVSTSYGHEQISLTVDQGEILGLYGLVGAGRTELVRSMLGLAHITAGDVLVHGQEARIRNPYEALRRYRIGYVSEDRKGEGLILSHSIERNVGVSIWDRLAGPLGWLTDKRVRPSVVDATKRLGIKLASVEQTVAQLSGGNQQKVSVAKWLAADVDMLVIDEPTIGVDIRTKEDMHRLIHDLADAGTGVLLISSDLAEVIRVADRVLVMAGLSIRADIANTHDYESMSARIMSHIVVNDPSTSQTK